MVKKQKIKRKRRKIENVYEHYLLEEVERRAEKNQEELIAECRQNTYKRY